MVEKTEVVKKDEKKVVEKFRVLNAVVETKPVIMVGDEQLSLEDVLVLILNKLDKLERGLL